MKNNKGFTLLELLVVVAIIGIVVGSMTYSINSVSSTRAKKFASDLNATMSQCRVDTMSGAPSPTYLELTKDNNGDYYATLYEGGSDAQHIKTQQKLGGSGISCAFRTGSAANAGIAAPSDTDPKIETGTKLCLAFDRATGAFVKLADVKNGTEELNSSSITGDYCTYIFIASGGGSYTLALVPQTGYHSVSR